MTFLQMQQELSDRVSVYDQTVTDDATKLKRWLNMAIQYICGKKLWPFTLAEEIIQTVTDITTGTVSINASDTALTFSSAPSASVANRYIQLSTSNDWYKITAHTAASTSATISPAYVGTSNLSAGTYTVRKLLYTTTTPLMQIIDMKQLIAPGRVVSASPREADFLLPLYYGTGTPDYYIMSSPNSSGTHQFSFVPSPSAIMNINIRGIQKLSDLSADADIPVIPTPWHDGIVNVAAYYAFQGIDDSRAQVELGLGEIRIADMAKVYSHDLGRHRVMQPVVNQDYSMGWNLPPYLGRTL